MDLTNLEINSNNILNIPGIDTNKNIENIPTPKSDAILKRAIDLSKKSSYKTSFNFDAYFNLERRFHDKEFRGGVIYGNPMKLVNFHASCQQCLYAFEVDTYGRGCTHDCTYCYAKDQLTRHGYWNNPFPAPIDITEIWKIFYTVFETNKHSKWRKILEKRVPIRIGSMSDSFMMMDKKYKVTLEFLKILKHYGYPYIIFTRSDLIANDEYLAQLDPDLCSVQMSIASTNDKLNKLIEPGTPSAKRRLLALQKLTRAGFWTTVRLNPFFPIYPDGYFSNPDFDRSKERKLNYSTFEMVDEIAEYGVQSILAGFVRLSQHAMKTLSNVFEVNLYHFFNEEIYKHSKDMHYSQSEVRAYYERIQAKCIQNSIQFTTCYIGNPEEQFWRDQDLWSNKKDCCNAVNRINSFKSSSREIEWDERLRHTQYKCSKPNNPELINKEL